MRNWKTTLAGIVAGLIPVLTEAYDHLAHGDPVRWELVAMGLLIAMLGSVSKDYDVTGK